MWAVPQYDHEGVWKILAAPFAYPVMVTPLSEQEQPSQTIAGKHYGS